MDSLQDEADKVTFLFLLSTVTKLNLKSFWKGRNKRIKWSGERIGKIKKTSPWTDRDEIKRFLERELREFTGGKIVFYSMDVPKKEQVEQESKKLTQVLCSNKENCTQKSPDIEDLKLAMMIDQLEKPLDVYVIPNERECFGCILSYFKESDSKFSQVSILTP